MDGTSHRSSARRRDALRRPASSSSCAPRSVVASARGVVFIGLQQRAEVRMKKLISPGTKGEQAWHEGELCVV
eukprot:338418-Alexandrium_andersonii.AAC.1